MIPRLKRHNTRNAPLPLDATRTGTTMTDDPLEKQACALPNGMERETEIEPLMCQYGFPKDLLCNPMGSVNKVNLPGVRYRSSWYGGSIQSPGSRFPHRPAVPFTIVVIGPIAVSEIMSRLAVLLSRIAVLADGT
jgi:hypothetical protein